MLDLGSGSGLTAIAAMRAGAARVLAADIDALALAAIGLNAAANAVAVEATQEDLLAGAPGRFDIVLVGDLFYERTLAERVLAFIEAASANGAEMLVGDPRRSYFPKDRFRQVAEYAVPVTRELEDAEIKRTAVWQLSPSPHLKSGERELITPIDAALVAVVAGRAHVDVGHACIAEHRLRRLDHGCGGNDLAGAVDDAIVGAVATNQIVLALEEHGAAPPRCRDGAGSSPRAGRSAPARRRAGPRETGDAPGSGKARPP